MLVRTARLLPRRNGRMQVARLNSRSPADSRAARFQSAFLRAGRPAVRPECSTAIYVNLRAVRSSGLQMTRMGAEGEAPLMARWVSSSAFIREIRGKPGLSSDNAAPSPRSVAECGGGPAVSTARMIAALQIDPREIDPF